jgi:N-acetylglutamate synthase-like GNAT family acetyltransferase
MILSEVTTRRAKESDTDDILRVINDARIFLGSRGVDQWQDGFPDRQVILDDITKRIAFVLTTSTVQETIIGFFVLSLENEPSYSQISGDGWMNKGSDYAAIHRVAVSSDHRGKGSSGLIFLTCETEAAMRKVRSIRVDTHKDNAVMKHVILKNGYIYCGNITLSRDNAERMAFEKFLT